MIVIPLAEPLCYLFILLADTKLVIVDHEFLRICRVIINADSFGIFTKLQTW